MPEHAASTIDCPTILRGFNSLADSKVLMISGENLELLQSFVGETDVLPEMGFSAPSRRSATHLEKEAH